MSTLLACHTVPGQLHSVAVLRGAQPQQGLSPHAGVWGCELRPRPGLEIHPLDTTLLSSLVFNCHCYTFKGVCPNGQGALPGSPSGVSDGYS